MKKLSPYLAVFCLLMLLFNPSLSFSGALQGLSLWGSIVLPTLLPFMICTGAVIGFQGVDLITRPLAPLFRLTLQLTSKGSFVFLCGLLCGYPMGAKIDSEFLSSRKISFAEAKYLLAICSYPSPMFLAGYTAGRLRDAGIFCPVPCLLAAVYLPALPMAFLARRYFKNASAFAEKGEQENFAARSSFSFDGYMMDSFETMVRIGGYIMLFSMAAVFLTHMRLTPGLAAILTAGLEMTTGIPALCASLSRESAVPLVAAAAAFGGISGIFQTKSVLKNPELSIRDYVCWKCLHGTLAAVVMICFHRLGLW